MVFIIVLIFKYQKYFFQVVATLKKAALGSLLI